MQHAATFAALLLEPVVPKSFLHTVDALVSALKQGGTEGRPHAVLERSRIPVEGLAGLLPWSGRKYERICLARETGFELFLIGYEPGQATSIHDYDSAEAWVMPVLGELQEERFDLDAEGRPLPVHTTILRPGHISYLSQERGIHRFTNTGHTRSMTLNIYAGPVKRWRVYSGYGHAWMPVGS